VLSTKSQSPTPFAVTRTASFGYSFLRPPQAADELGRLGPYRILQLLGRGGMGLVFRAEDSLLNRAVALKVMLPEHASGWEARARFLREARAAATVEHDHIVPIFQVDEDNNTPFLAMPLLKGQSLHAALGERPQQPVGEVLRVGRQIAEGLAAAHAAGLIHRDIKPANVWLEGAGRRVKILDFGLARVVGPAAERAADAPSDLTQTGMVVGTPAYMSPEQASGAGVGPQSDLYSLGVVLYQMAVGRLPHDGIQGTAAILAAAGTPPSPPADVRADLPPPLNALILRLMARSSAERPGSAAEVADELRAIEQAGSTVAPAPPPRVRAWWVWVAGGATLAVTLAGLVAFDRMNRPPATAVATPPAAVEPPPPVVETTATGLLGDDRFAYGSPDSLMTVSPDGSLLAVCTSDPEARVWVFDTATRQVVSKLSGHTDRVFRMAFFPDGRRLVSGSVDGTAKVWNLATGEAETTFTHNEWGGSVAVRADGAEVATGGLSSVRVWDVASGTERHHLTGHAAHIHGLAYSPTDPHLLASAGQDGAVRLWDTRNGRGLAVLQGPRLATEMAFSPDGKLIACGHGTSVKVWRVADRTPAFTADVSAAWVRFTPDGSGLWCGPWGGGEEPVLSRLDSAGRVRLRVKLSDVPQRSGFAVRGDRVYAGNHSGAGVIDAASGKVLAK
jgi:hypothetical protein